jgi:hypothetical protein
MVPWWCWNVIKLIWNFIELENSRTSYFKWRLGLISLERRYGYSIKEEL